MSKGTMSVVMGPIEGVDLEEALEHVQDPDLLRELLHELARTWSDGASRVARALATDGPEKAGDVAHALAGTASTLGVGRVSVAARRVEESLRSGTQEATQRDLAELEAALASFVRAFSAAAAARV